MNFFRQQERAKSKTVLLAFLIIFAVLSIIIAAYLLIAAIMLYVRIRGGGPDCMNFLFDLRFIAALALGVIVTVSAGSLYKILQL